MNEVTKLAIIGGHGIAAHTARSLSHRQESVLVIDTLGSGIQDFKTKEVQEQLYELTRQDDYQTEFLSGREKRRDRRKKERHGNKKSKNNR